MRSLIILFCCLLTLCSFAEEEFQDELVLSTPDQFASLISEPDYLIGGLVSPLSEQLSLRMTDLIVKGAQNIFLTRVYIPPHMPVSFPQHKHNQQEHDKMYLHQHLVANYKGWQIFPHLKLHFNPKLKEVRLSDSSGATLDFKIDGSLVSPSFAISNAAGDIPSRKYDPRNTKFSYEEGGNKIVVYAPNGTSRFYYRKENCSISLLTFLLQKEILPNGKVLKYHYNPEGQLTYVESLDPLERYVYASLRLMGSSKEGRCHFISSSSTTADYIYQKRAVQAKIKEHTHKMELSSQYPSILTSVSSPFYRHETLDYCGRFCLSAYSGKDDVFSIEQTGFGKVHHYRVHKLSLPVGVNDASQEVYEMHYDPPSAGEKEGSTKVKNSDGTSTVYHFSKNLLPASIAYFGEDGTLKKEKVYTWSDNHWLTSIELKCGQTSYKTTFEYDAFGNPILEIFTGEITGSGVIESRKILREYSQDGRNLCLKEEHENGKTLYYAYLSNTNLITAKIIKDGDQTLTRELFHYDDCYNLIQSISEDGLEKHITNYVLRQNAPFLHMPEMIEEKYLDQGVEKLLTRKCLTYDNYGNVAAEKIYDANEQLAYTIYKEYNARGDLLSETNALGQKAIYGYDSKGHCISATNFSGRIQKTMRYDAKGRRALQIENGDDGVSRTTSFEYDFNDRMIQKINPFGHTARYTYDPLVNQLICTDFMGVSTHSTYDPLGNKITQDDANGNRTNYRYNAYGSLVEVLYPDGGKEQFRYEKDGALASYTDQEGLTVKYKRDALGRILSKTYGENLTEEKFTYSGFHLLSRTDKEGNIISYVYDGAGRKIREDISGHITDFSYDSLGRVNSLCAHNGENTLITHFKRDLLGNILEEKKTDAAGSILSKIEYAYDADGNKTAIIRQQSVDSFKYDSFGRLIEHKDPCNFVTRRSYNENHINPLGQRVLQTTIIDPRGIATIETKDVFNRLVQKEIVDTEHNTLLSEEKVYDLHGNQIFQKDHVYEKDLYQSTKIIAYTYTPTHKIESLTKAYGGKDSNTTHYTYYSSKKIKTKTFPDGITLSHEYNPFGFLSRLTSSDGKIFQTYKYNKLGHLIDAADENGVILRTVDAFGNVTQEISPSKLVLDKEYDDFNRLVSLKIAGMGEISYSYDPLYLRKVTRLSDNGEVLYTHSYDDYDLSGNLLSEKLIGNLGNVQHKTDKRGLKTSIASPYFSQDCFYDAAQNLIENVTDLEKYGYTYDGLSQLSCERGPRSLTYAHDSLYNRTKKDDVAYKTNELNQLLPFSYDLNGNQTIKHTLTADFQLTYDPLNRLVEATSLEKKILFSYDALGRRLNKTISSKTDSGWKEIDHEDYLYHGQHEIGAFASQKPKNFRVLGFDRNNNPSTVAIELYQDRPRTWNLDASETKSNRSEAPLRPSSRPGALSEEEDRFDEVVTRSNSKFLADPGIKGQVFAPLLDVQGNVRKLVDLSSKAVADSYDFTAFGEEMTIPTLANPWRFASKHFDPELSLIYFGKRYYDPAFARWLTQDPAGFIDSTNLYQYVLNNPFRYQDPEGESLWGYVCGIGQIVLGGVIVASGVVLEVCTVGGYTIAFGLHESCGLALMASGCAMTSYHANDISPPALYKDKETSNSEFDYWNEYEEKLSDNDRKKGNKLPPNRQQNKQAADARKRVEQETGKKITKEGERKFHDQVTGQGYNYHELVEEGIGLYE